jgi:hypothetical protein
MWIIPSELTDALKGIGGMLGRGEGGGPFSSGNDEDDWVDPGELKDAFDDTVLEDPAQALAEARGMAGKASQEATEHAAPVQRVQPPSRPPADAVPDYEPPSAPPAVPPPPGMPDEGPEAPPR